MSKRYILKSFSYLCGIYIQHIVLPGMIRVHVHAHISNEKTLCISMIFW